jgi:hypothetical protein
VDELRAAGALDVPAAWRKSLGGGGEPKRELPLFPDFFDEDDAVAEKKESTPPDADESTDELL